jgi:hypothetical protein
MPGTFTCRHCGKNLPCNPRLKKKQTYCSSASCQQARKNAWGRKEYRTNKTHRKKRLESQKACYVNRPGHAYQSAYREKHPEYAQRNRELQRKRNKRRPKDRDSMIVNTDAFAPCKSMRWGFNRRTHININETPLSFPAGSQSCSERVSHPLEASLA